MRTDSVNGFVSDLEVYSGKDNTATGHLGYKLMECPIHSRWLPFHFYFVNFSLLPLFDSDGLHASGTFCKDGQDIHKEIRRVRYASFPANYQYKVQFGSKVN